jgi:hypothetical protein
MTTKIELVVNRDALIDGGIVRLNRNAFTDHPALMAAEWTIKGSSCEQCFETVLDYVCRLICERLNGYTAWLLAGHSAWQPDTKIVRYRRLFNSLAVNGIDFEDIPERREAMVQQDGKVKFFGVVRLNESLLTLVQKVMGYRSSTYIALMPESEKEDFPLIEGWSGQWDNDSSLIKIIAARQGMLLQRTGFFDDPESGILALGPVQVVNKLIVSGVCAQ